MPRPAQYPWDRIFDEIRDGMSKDDVCAKYGMSKAVLRNKLRKASGIPPKPRPPKPKPSPVLSLAEHPALTMQERARLAKYDKADARVQANQASTRKAIDASGVDRRRLQKVIRLAIRNLEVSTDNEDADKALKWSRMLTNTAEKLGHVLQSEDQLAPPDNQPSAETAEGREVIATMLSQNRGLLAQLLAGVDEDAFTYAVNEANRLRGKTG